MDPVEGKEIALLCLSLLLISLKHRALLFGKQGAALWDCREGYASRFALTEWKEFSPEPEAQSPSVSPKRTVEGHSAPISLVFTWVKGRL